MRNGNVPDQQTTMVAAVLIDPATGKAVSPGGSGSGSSIDFELLIIVDANQVAGIRRELYEDGVTTVEYEDFMGGAWVPVQPVTLWSPALPPGAATSAGQAALLASVGQQADVPAAGDSASGSVIGFLKRVATLLTAMRAQLPATLGGKVAAQSLSVTPATDANVSRETYATVTIMAVATSGTGATYVAFGAQACSSLDIVNNTGVDIEVRRGAAGNTLVVRDGYSRLIQGITNASQIQVRRADVSNTPASVTAEAFNV